MSLMSQLHLTLCYTGKCRLYLLFDNVVPLRQLLHKLLTHEDLMVHFERYYDKRLQVITEEGFKKFLMEVQHTTGSQVEAQMKEMQMLEEPFRKAVRRKRFCQKYS